MIHEVEGDILLTQADVIAHGVAASDPMNQGLALSVHAQGLSSLVSSAEPKIR